MNYEIILWNLKAEEKELLKKGYRDSALFAAWKREILMKLNEAVVFLGKISKQKTIVKKREPSAYNLHIAKERVKGKSMKEAVESWKKIAR